MTYKTNIFCCNAIIVLLAGVSCSAVAQSPCFTSVVSTGKMSINDSIQLTLSIKNIANLLELKPNGFGDFKCIHGPYQTSSTSIEHGIKTLIISLNYILKPAHEGKLVIPAATAKDATGHTYLSNPVKIEVVAAVIK